MSRIWVVSSGQYSDYRVECVCATREIAESVAAMRRESSRSQGWAADLDVEELFMYTDAPRMVDWWIGTAKVNRGTAVAESVRFENHTDLEHMAGYPFDYKVKKRPTVKVRNAPAGFFVNVFGLDEAGVKKAMSDFLVQLTPEDTRRR